MEQKEYIRKSKDGAYVKIVGMEFSENGTVEEVVNNFEHSNHPVTSIPYELKLALRNTLNKREINMFENVISSKECSAKTLMNKTLNQFVRKCINDSIGALHKKKPESSDDGKLESTYLFAFFGPPISIVIKLIIDSRLIESGFYDFNLSIDDFKELEDNKFSLESHSEEDSQTYHSIGLSYRFLVSGTKEDIFRLNPYNRDDFDFSRDKSFYKLIESLLIPQESKRTNDYWMCLDHFLFYEVKIAPFDRVNKDEESLVDRDNLVNKNHVVYVVRDEYGVVKYIGEGRENRPSHVNSGTSHVYELNKAHFEGKKLDVEIYNKNLTKIEALSIERLLLHKYKKCGLWNKRDYIK